MFATEPAGNDRIFNVDFPMLACGLGEPRRTHRDLADVVELIVVNDLHGDFARLLHKSVRPEDRKLVKHARGSA